jgi:hypothetical protein
MDEIRELRSDGPRTHRMITDRQAERQDGPDPSSGCRSGELTAII